MEGKGLRGLEVVEDRTAGARCDEGFLTLRRLVVRNLYDDGSASPPYPCDVLERPGSDAVVAVLFERAGGRVRVLLREAPRGPVHLRKDKRFVHPDPREYTTILEVVAGLVESVDTPGEEGLRSRAVIEAREEAGVQVSPDACVMLGGETFASPGTTDEKLYFCAVETPLEDRVAPTGDGSVMEEWSRVHLVDLGEAIAMCRDGRVPDMKTEVALLRLADHLGYVHSLDAFAEDLERR